jgi:hypothetical protein
MMQRFLHSAAVKTSAQLAPTARLATAAKLRNKQILRIAAVAEEELHTNSQFLPLIDCLIIN